jgi:hypothetical protein
MSTERLALIVVSCLGLGISFGWWLHNLATIKYCTGCGLKALKTIDHMYCEDHYCTKCQDLIS